MSILSMLLFLGTPAIYARTTTRISQPCDTPTLEGILAAQIRQYRMLAAFSALSLVHSFMLCTTQLDATKETSPMSFKLCLATSAAFGLAFLASCVLVSLYTAEQRWCTHRKICAICDSPVFETYLYDKIRRKCTPSEARRC
ncbi:hypothetical protein CERSUDRAFT_117555 [Gelatoporia subvermispora B]|uniref:Uncharacterized protein n=1 Tax=Ceriporiopsis subvermispora (strain B) TaxID=914234 RepID=M2QAR9_CERS8|nr:hypothetical protein CERSUDRAFT_117555 [Gelatoporia subvermispora B]